MSYGQEEESIYYQLAVITPPECIPDMDNIMRFDLITNCRDE